MQELLQVRQLHLYQILIQAGQWKRKLQNIVT